MTAPDVSILVVSYNTRPLTLECLRSIYAETRGIGFEVVVADNASTDGSAEAVRLAFPEARLLALSENRGFAAANNLAAQQAAGRYLCLLNPDAAVTDRAVERLVRFAEAHPEAALFGGQTRFPDGRLNPASCWGRPTPWSLFCLGTGLASLFRGNALFDPESLGGWKRDSVRRVDIVSGCFLLVRRAVWEALNGFDEGFFLYGEDADLCLRGRNQGHAALLCPEARVIHHGGASERVRADKLVRLFSAKARLFARHWPPAARAWGGFMLDLWALSRTAAWRALSLIKPSRAESYDTWRSVWRRRGEWGAALRGGLPPSEKDAVRPRPRKRATRGGILAIASGGGHWAQLLRLRAAFAGHRTVYASVSSDQASEVPGARYYAVPDATRWERARLLRLAWAVFRILLRERPDVVVSTGAAPGLVALVLGKLLGARTVWIDSLANVESLSDAGRRARPWADLYLTQWPGLARPEGPRYEGSVA
ncbi:MAG: glycosyltransferase [Planctomycetota bacterium]